MTRAKVITPVTLQSAGRRHLAAGAAVSSSASQAVWIEDRSGGAWIAVRAQPGASRNAIEGVREGRLRLRVQAPPVEGAANDAVCRLLAKTLGVGKSKVRLVQGERSREKTIEIAGLSAQDVRAKLRLPNEPDLSDSSDPSDFQGGPPA